MRVTTTSANLTVITVKNLDFPALYISSRTEAQPGFTTTIKIRTIGIKPRAAISIRYQPCNPSNQSWVDETDGLVGTINFNVFPRRCEGGNIRTTEPLTFLQLGMSVFYETSFTILTRQDENNQNGSFALYLLDDTNNPRSYKLDTARSLNTNVTVRTPANPPPIYIVPGHFPDPTNLTGHTFRTITEYSEGSTINLNLRTHTDPTSSLQSLNLIATNMSGSFLNSSSVNSRAIRIEEVDWESAQISGGPGEGGATWVTDVSIPLRDADGIDSAHGEIKVTLQSGNGYSLPTASDQPREVILTIHDDVTPVISISNAPEISPTNTAQFTLQSDILPHKPLAIRYTAANTTGMFLGATTATQSVTFTQPTPDHPITGILTIPTVQDAGSTVGTITVTLSDDNTNPKDYTLPRSDPADPQSSLVPQTATVQIKATPKPTLSIRPSSENAVEPTSSGVAKFVVTASINPVNNVDLSYTVAEPNGDFLASDQVKTYRPSAVFRQVSPSTDYTYDIELSLRAKNEIDEEHGKVTVTLDAVQASATYIVASSPNNVAQKTIYDEKVPSITIERTSQTVDTLAGIDARLILISDTEPHQSLKIRFRATNSNTGGNFLDPTDGESGAVRISDSLTFSPIGISPNLKYQSTLIIPTTEDPDSTAGTINIVLLDDTESQDYEKDYTIPSTGVNISASVRVFDPPIRELSLNNTTPTTTDEGMTAMVTVSTDENPLRPLTIKYTPNNISGEYLDTTDGALNRSRTTEPLTFRLNTTSNKYEAQIPVDTNGDDLDKVHGEILITLDDPGENAKYSIASAPSNQNTVIVYDDETPTIKIAPPTPSTVTAGNNIEFKLTSNLEPTQDLVIRFTPDNDTGSFLDTSGNQDAGNVRESGPLKFEASGSDFVATLEVPTVDDPNATTGTISVDIEIDTTSSEKPRVHYQRSGTTNEQSAQVTVNDPAGKRTISIEASDNAVTINEGDTAEIVLTASDDPERPLDIEFTPANVSTGTFLDITGGANNTTRTQRVEFTETNSVWTGTIEVPTNTPNLIDDIDGSITVTLDTVGAEAVYITHSSNRRATITVKDADAPEITIDDAPIVVAGNEAKFKLTSSIRPANDQLTVFYIPVSQSSDDSGNTVTSNFLNSTNQPQTGDWMKTVPFSLKSGDELYTGELTVLTQDDTNFTEGVITVTLSADTTNTPVHYTVSPITALKTATATVVDAPVPELSISAKGISSLEGNSLNIVITAIKIQLIH